MDTYAIIMHYNEHTHTAIGETSGKAKYELYMDLADCFNDFKHFLNCIKSCKIERKFRIEDLFGDKKEFERMKKNRSIPFAYQGQKVEVDGKSGTIVGNYGFNLLVVYDCEYHSNNCHPWWRVKYFDKEGNLIKNFKGN